MKLHDRKFFFCILALASVTCHATDSAVLSLEVTTPAQLADQLNMDNVYRVFEAGGKQYYAGFEIDSGGINHPLLVEFDDTAGKQHSWRFDDIITDIFIYRSYVSVVLDNGKIYSWNNQSWVENPLQLQSGSEIVYSDQKQRFISCSPASPGMANTNQGGCESFHPNWKAAFSWRQPRPKVCGDYLYAVTWSQHQSQRLMLDLSSGKVLKQQAFKGGDICEH